METQWGCIVIFCHAAPLCIQKETDLAGGLTGGFGDNLCIANVGFDSSPANEEEDCADDQGEDGDAADPGDPGAIADQAGPGTCEGDVDANGTGDEAEHRAEVE